MLVVFSNQGYEHYSDKCIKKTGVKNCPLSNPFGKQCWKNESVCASGNSRMLMYYFLLSNYMQT
jgi:hypothetical protein